MAKKQRRSTARREARRDAAKRKRLSLDFQRPDKRRRDGCGVWFLLGGLTGGNYGSAARHSVSVFYARIFFKASGAGIFRNGKKRTPPK